MLVWMPLCRLNSANRGTRCGEGCTQVDVSRARMSIRNTDVKSSFTVLLLRKNKDRQMKSSKEIYWYVFRFC